MRTSICKGFDDVPQCAEGRIDLLRFFQHASDRSALADLLAASQVNKRKLSLSNPIRRSLAQHKREDGM